jgi:hypothetical protein
MTFKNLLKIAAGTVGALALSMPAQAAGFTGFAFNTSSTYANNPTEDIFLNSVSHGTSNISNFSLVTGAAVIENGHPTLGPSSTDLGDDATSPNAIGANELPTGQEVADFLGNLNLNNIIDTEEYSRSVFELDFGKKVNTFYLFERGMNSSLTVEALDAAGAVIDNFHISQGLWQSAGYKLDTTEIGFAQNVGSYGLKLDSAVKKVRIISDYADFGPDYKIVAAQVPEPSTMAALGLIGGAALLAKRRKPAAA